MQSTLDLAYNTDHNDLVIPEYGRNIHQMVQHAMTISDKNERNKCAETIIKVMDLINPNAKKNSNSEEHHQKLWSHLHIISKFELDVDSPYGAPKENTIQNLIKSLIQAMPLNMDTMARLWRIWLKKLQNSRTAKQI